MDLTQTQFDDLLVSTAQLARLLGVSVYTIRGWAREEGLPRVRPGVFELGKALRWWRERVSKRGGKAELEHWTTQYRKVKAQLEQIKLERERGELIPRAEIAKLWAMRAAEVKAGLMQLIRKLPPRLEGLEKEEMAEIIREEVYAVLKRYTRKGPYTPPVEEAERPKKTGKNSNEFGRSQNEGQQSGKTN